MLNTIFRTSESPDIDNLMTWFATEDQCRNWGGPGFRYPFTQGTFFEDLNWQRVESHSLLIDDSLVGFGQIYEKFGRRHLARIATNPQYRGMGLGRKLLRELVGVSRERFPGAECSLYVYRHNVVAIACYRSVGFLDAPVAEEHPVLKECYFMVLPADNSIVSAQ